MKQEEGYDPWARDARIDKGDRILGKRKKST